MALEGYGAGVEWTLGVDEPPWFVAHARLYQHETVAELNGPAHCRTCGQMEPFGELVYGALRSDAEIREEVERIVRASGIER